MHDQSRDPWNGVQEVVASVGSNVSHNWQSLVRHCGRQLQPWHRNVSQLVAGVQQLPRQVAQWQEQEQQRTQQQQHYWAPALAVSTGIYA